MGAILGKMIFLDVLLRLLCKFSPFNKSHRYELFYAPRALRLRELGSAAIESARMPSYADRCVYAGARIRLAMVSI